MRWSGLVAALATVVADRDLGHPVRVAVDGPVRAPRPELAGPMVAALRERGRPADTVDAGGFLRPASLRLERGRDDPAAFYEDWLDLAALRREVLDPLGPGGDRRYLPSRWDAAADRATRAAYRRAPPDAVVVVSGWFLLRLAADFDVTVALCASDAARARRVAAADGPRELPAYRRYDAEVAPARVADVTVRVDDEARPAVVWAMRQDRSP